MNMTDEILNSWTDADECLAEKMENAEERAAVDLAKFTSSAIKNITSAGWYRCFEYASGSETASRMSQSTDPIFTIMRGYWSNNGECHRIEFMSTFNKLAFINENSVSGQNLITKIRFVFTSDRSYVDIYYSGSSINNIGITVMNSFTPGNLYWKAISNPYMVEETGSGNVGATFTFSANRTIESRLAALEAK